MVLQAVPTIGLNFLMERIICYLLISVDVHKIPYRVFVPQGTVLGPVLFLCFSANITGSVNTSTLRTYADDTRIFKGVTDQADCQFLQNDLNAIFSWLHYDNCL